MKSISKSPAKDSPPYSDDKVKIIIRLRPIIGDQEDEKFVQLEDAYTLKILRPGNHSHMRFNNILNSNSSQPELFELIRDSIDHFLDGVNNTIFAYGQTGAGKTYSIIGDYSHLDSRDNLENYLRGNHKGVLSRSLEQIFYETKKRKDKDNSKILISFIELYNEKIFDLINPSQNALDIRESKQGQIEIIGVLRQQVNNLEKAIELVATGLKNRVTGSTHANSKSSRSHSIFQITYQKTIKINGIDQVRASSLKIVDLAGSEKYKIPCDLTTSERQARVQQLRYINSSLSCLGHCISALIEKSRTHIPFRDSKLTRILSDSLVGPGKMKFIVCISPSITASAETFSTLQFASRAKKAILDRIPKHLLSKKSSMSQQFSVLKEELEKEKELRVQSNLQLKNLKQKLLQYQKQNKLLKKENEELRLKIKYPNPINIGQETSNLLKLSVFKQNKQFINSKNIDPPPKPIKEESKKITVLEQKKQKFDKRIQTFIEKESPTNSIKIPAEYSFGKVEYSFQPESYANQNYKQTPEESFQNHQYSNQEEETFELYQECQSLFKSENNDSTSNFIEKTCKNMNVKCLGELKEEMLRARNQLKYFQEKDSYLEGLKLAGSKIQR